MTLDLIAFDGDDTLWHNERSYRDGRERFRRLLADAGVVLGVDEIEARVNQTELANLEYYGYGVSSFVLSLIETAIDLTDGCIQGREIQTIINFAKEMLANRSVDVARKLNPALQSFEQFVTKQKAAIKTAMGV